MLGNGSEVHKMGQLFDIGCGQGCLKGAIGVLRRLAKLVVAHAENRGQSQKHGENSAQKNPFVFDDLCFERLHKLHGVTPGLLL